MNEEDHVALQLEVARLRAELLHAVMGHAPGRGLQSSTVRLDISAFCRGCLGGVQEVSGDIMGYLWCILCQKRLRLS